MPIECGIWDFMVSKGNKKNCKPKAVLCTKGKYIKIATSWCGWNLIPGIL